MITTRKIIFFLVSFYFITDLFAVYNVQNWFLRLREEPWFYLSPLETSQPLIVSESVYFGSENGFFYSLNKRNGKVLWKKAFEHGVSGSAVYSEPYLYFGANNGTFYCLEAKTGTEKWSYFVNYIHVSEPLLVKGIIYLTGGDNSIYALDAKTGKWLWQYKRNFPKPLTVRGQSPPTYFDNNIYIGFSDGFLVKINALDGKLVWEKKLNDYHRFIDIDAAPYVDKSIVLAPAYDGKLYALNPDNGSTKWEYEKGGAKKMLVVENTIYLPTQNGELVVLDKDSGKKIWSHSEDIGVLTTPVIKDNLLFYGTSNNYLYALDLTKRKKVWSLSLGAGISTSPVIDNNNNIYFITNYGNVHSMKLEGLKFK